MIFILYINNIHFGLLVSLDIVIVEPMDQCLSLVGRVLDEPGHTHAQSSRPRAITILVVIVVYHGGKLRECSRLGWSQSYTEGKLLLVQ